jgi:hypothetical protein
MSVQEIETAITQLAPDELAQLAEWFAEYHWQVWDQQIERDVKAGKLDALVQRAKDRFVAGECKPL